MSSEFASLGQMIGTVVLLCQAQSCTNGGRVFALLHATLQLSSSLNARVHLQMTGSIVHRARDHLEGHLTVRVRAEQYCGEKLPPCYLDATLGVPEEQADLLS
jgi:hypothetical protein